MRSRPDYRDQTETQPIRSRSAIAPSIVCALEHHAKACVARGTAVKRQMNIGVFNAQGVSAYILVGFSSQGHLQELPYQPFRDDSSYKYPKAVKQMPKTLHNMAFGPKHRKP